jgi:hypothetical protein
MSRWTRAHPRLAACVDWLGVFVAATSFVYIALWAASPDSAQLTLEEAIWRSLSYSIPITLGMWGISRATRRGSAVPPRMSEAMPYARLGKDGKPEAVTWTDQTPTKIGDTSAND